IFCFQAQDGIRYPLVTGVQTCALPIFLADVKAAYERHGRCVIAVSEGIHDAAGVAIASQLAKAVERDAHGNVQLSGTGALADLRSEKRRVGEGSGALVVSFAQMAALVK